MAGGADRGAGGPGAASRRWMGLYGPRRCYGLALPRMRQQAGGGGMMALRAAMDVARLLWAMLVRRDPRVLGLIIGRKDDAR
jgi:hypothetical protein